MTQVLDVFLHEEKIGTLTLLPNDTTLFSFEESYINDSNRATLSQSFIRPESGELITDTRPYRQKLPPFFSNLLPEGRMREYLAERGGVKQEREFFLLRLLGDDLAGAITVRDSGGVGARTAQDAIEHKPETAGTYHFSLAGVQLKFSALMRQGGLTIPAHGVGGDWIVKLPSAQFAHVPENEYAMMQLAQKIGIEVPETQLIPIENITGLPDLGVLQGKQALAVKRFDRTKNGAVHIEDFAQVYTVFPDEKYAKAGYKSIANMVWTLTGEAGLSDFISRLTFSILTGNGDMHLKNWSFIYPDKKTPRLSPAYDLVSTIPYIPEDGLALKFLDTKDMGDITLASFERLARKAELPTSVVLNAVKETVEKTRAGWESDKSHYGLPADIRKRIDAHMTGLALTQGYAL